MTSTAVDEATESNRDTKISRSQAETRKSSPPPLMPEDLDLAPRKDERRAGKPVVESPTETDEEIRRAEAMASKQISRLAKQLAPLASDEDSLLRGGRVQVERRLVTEDQGEGGVPAWVWIAGAGAIVALIVVAILFAALR